MAIDLKAIITLEDRFTSPLKSVQRQIERINRIMGSSSRQSNLWRDSNGRLRDSLGRFARDVNRADNSIGRLNSTTGRATSGVGKLIGALGGMAAAYGAVRLSKEIFDATVYRAMEREQSSVMIGAMFNDKEIAKEYQSMVDKMALESPVFDSQQMYSNSKSFITASKDVKQLEKMWSLAERLVAIDPAQGIEGAVFALREMFSGDAISMVRRFEMPKQVMNEIKKMDLDDQLVALDEYFSKIGMTQKLIDEMGNTTLGKWQQVKEKISLIGLEMGKPALEPISKFIDDIMVRLNSGELDSAIQFGGRIIQGTITGLTNSVIGIYDWFQYIANSPEWKNATTLSAKVNFVIDDLLARFNEWYESTGEKGVEKATETVMNAIVGFLEDNSGRIAEAAWSIGSKMGSSIIKGAKSALSDSWIGKAVLSAGIGAGAGSAFAGVGAIPGALIGGGASVINSGYKWLTGDILPKDYGKKKDKGHAGGLDNVPYDGYKASLHKGERVLTRQEAREFRQGNGSGNNYYFNFTTTAGSTEQEAEQILGFIIKKLEIAGGAGA